MRSTPTSDQAPATCQIATGTWRSPTGGTDRAVTYIITDYQPKQCLTAPVPGNPVLCEPPPPELNHATTVYFTVAGPDTLIQSEAGMAAQYTREPVMPPVPPDCYDPQ
jgi:hypothetical protein